jgi:hypothetical protein
VATAPLFYSEGPLGPSIFFLQTVCPKSGFYAHPFGTKFDGHADTVEAIMWTLGTCHLEFVSRPPTPYVHFISPNFYGKSGTPNLGQTVMDRFENLWTCPRQQYIHCGKILRQSEIAKTFEFLCPGKLSNSFLTLLKY